MMNPEQLDLSPGPWEIEWDTCDCGGDYPCAHGSFPYKLIAPNRQIPNPLKHTGTHAANLVSLTEYEDVTLADVYALRAAPDLLAVCRALVEWAGAARVLPTAEMVSIVEIVQRAQAALERATYDPQRD